MLLLSAIFNVPYELTNKGFTFLEVSDYVRINSYSMLFMLVCVFVGLLYIMLKSFIFHDTHINPVLAARLFTLRLDSFIQASFDLYSQGAVWLSYLYLLTVVIIAMVFTGMLYSWIFVVAFIMSIVATVLLVFDIENELEYTKDSKEEQADSLDEYVLEMEV